MSHDIYIYESWIIILYTIGLLLFFETKFKICMFLSAQNRSCVRAKCLVFDQNGQCYNHSGVT